MRHRRRLAIIALLAPSARSFTLPIAPSAGGPALDLLPDLIASYSAALVESPLETKVATAAVLAVAGDGLAQSREPGDYDVRRGISFIAFDSAYRGAFQHYTFPIIIDACQGNVLRGATDALHVASDPALLSTLERTCLNQLIVVPIVYYPLFFAMTGAVQGLSGTESVQRARENFLPLMKRNLQFWLPVQYVQFAFVAPEWQVTYVAVLGLVWNVILSALAGSATGGDEAIAAAPSVGGEAVLASERLDGVAVPTARVGAATDTAERTKAERDVA